VAKPTHAADLLGASRLAVDAVAGVTELVEAVHMNILNNAIGTPAVKPVAAVTKLVYRSVRGVTGVVGGALDQILQRLAPAMGEQGGWAGRDALQSAVCGVLGDRMEASNNPLAIQMALRRNGAALVADQAALRQAIPGASGRVLVLVHGLCMNDLQWEREGVDFGAVLERERGYTIIYIN
jgi:hypothetical protein